MVKLRLLIVLLLLPAFSSAVGWRTDFEKAKMEAKQQHKLILLKFSGSDWCIPCIRMEKEIFSTDTFQHFSEHLLIAVNADFPRLARNKLSRTLTDQNEKLAERYNKEGHFPYLVLLDSDGKVLNVWDGYKGMRPEELIAQLKPNVAL
jgi:thioredoxin-related protein